VLETSALLDLIDLLYGGALDTQAWGAAVAAIRRAFGGETAGVFLHDVSSRDVDSVTFVDVDESYRRAYAELARLPDMEGAFRAVAASAPRGALTADELALAAPDFQRSRFRDEWQRPQRFLDFIMAPLAPGPSLVGGLVVARPRRANGYGGRELDALRPLRPHLSRAVQVRRRLDGAAGVARDALAALDRIHQAVLLVDAGATVMHANPTAEAALESADGLRAARSVLGCDHADDTARLRRLVGEASAAPVPGPGGTLAVRRRSGRRPLSVLVAPLRGGRPAPTGPPATAIVLVADPEAVAPAPGAPLRELYGLTAAEARVAAALLDHDRLDDVAGGLGVSLATVRTLLQRAFDKTGTRRQADLVRLMLAHRLPVPDGAALRP
jgi:DNA-binding CsgD family transcriptional regulator